MYEDKAQLNSLPVICNKYWIGMKSKRHGDNDYLFHIAFNGSECLISLYAVLEALNSFEDDSLQKALNNQLGIVPPIAEKYWQNLAGKNPDAFVHRATGARTETAYIGLRCRYGSIVSYELMFRDNFENCRSIPLKIIVTIVYVAARVLELIPEPIAAPSLSKRLLAGWLSTVTMRFFNDYPRDLPKRSSLVLATRTLSGVEGIWTVVDCESFLSKGL